MNIVALTHTEGVLLNNKYIVLELAYIDIMGRKQHFLIKSPISYSQAKLNCKYIDKSLEVVMCTSSVYRGRKVYNFYEILQLLKHQYMLLKYYYGWNICFGYKGKSFQKDILMKCNIPCINIEHMGVPSINTLMMYYPDIQKYCLYHLKHSSKCADHILRLIVSYWCTTS